MRRATAVPALTAAALAAALAVPAQGQNRFETSAGPVKVERIAGEFENPWGLAFLPGGEMLVTERDGRLLLLRGGAPGSGPGSDPEPVAGLPAVWASGQGGLLDVVASPDFEQTGRIYFTFSEEAADGARTAAARAVLKLDGAPRLEAVQVIFRQSPARPGGRHFGSRIVFKDDGTLWITTGDRGRRRLAQDPKTHIGKVIRIAPDGSVPPDNPFVGDPGALPEIWSLGHRNAQGAARHPETGALWTLEHGAAGGDEVNQPEAGKNYGWPEISYGRHYSGDQIGLGTEAPGMEQPKHYWDPSIAPSGLAFYDGDLFPAWKGDLFAGALKYELLARLEMEDGRIVGEERLFEEAFGRIRAVNAGPDGAIWFLTDEIDGGLYRISPASE